MKFWKFTLIISFCVASYVHAEDKVIERVTFQEFHDPGWMILVDSDGVEREASFYYLSISLDDIYEWEVGETFDVILSETTGVTIKRLSSGDIYDVFFEGNYPLEKETDNCMKEVHGTTQGIAGCYGLEAKYWKAIGSQLHSFIYFHANKELKEALDNEKLAWEMYQEVRDEAVVTYFYQQTGTAQLIYNAEDSIQQNKDRVQSLQRFLR